eukprot:TRINITY_DN4584_c0_g1_i5.p1 TRINITY_DN4584_c0_g1~~TRINITY_DN4584_c0_g1_i5.p1  ORF type:complete len:328 (-),score=92.20 TRINITY_DN4584_c0_g1_i5:104-1012(-)
MSGVDGWLQPWTKKAALSLGAAVVVGVAVHRLTRSKASAAQAKCLQVLAFGDDVAKVEADKSWNSHGSSKRVDRQELQHSGSGFERIEIYCSASKWFAVDMGLLQQCLERLQPGGVVVAALLGLSDGERSALDTAALFAGATDSRWGEASASGFVEFSCTKPAWATSSAAAIPGVDRINEDELLGELPAPVGKGKSDCSSAPKACANCSCGRKELEDKYGAEEAKTRLEQGKERSSCNSCYLGDAFRCESCPYRGLPAFKPGTKVELSSGETAGTGQFAMKEDDGGDSIMQDITGGKLVITA